LRIPGQVFPRQLPPDQLRIFGEKQDASLKLDLVWTLFYVTLKQ